MPRTAIKELEKVYRHRFCDRCDKWFQKTGKTQKICEECATKRRLEFISELNERRRKKKEDGK